MWTNQTQVPGTSPARRAESPGASSNEAPAIRPASSSANTVACLPDTIEVTGKICGQADLRIDGRVEGPISLEGHRLTVGPTGQLKSEVTANEIVVQGRVVGNLRARDRIEIKNGGSVAGDIHTARISIEDGADFKGRAEIEAAKPHSAGHSRGVPTVVSAETKQE